MFRQPERKCRVWLALVPNAKVNSNTLRAVISAAIAAIQNANKHFNKRSESTHRAWNRQRSAADKLKFGLWTLNLLKLLKLILQNYTLDFRIHFACQHKPQHFIIGDKRPPRIFETRGFVFLDEEMRKPRKSVTDHQTKWNIKPVSAANKPNEQNNAKSCSDKMQIAG